jgi:glucose/arabinose dehydrogenase
MRFTLVSALVVTMVAGGAAQQTVPLGRGGTPVAPSGIPAVPLPDKPLEFDTAEGQKIRVVVVARGMSAPWSMVWLPGGDMLITQRTGQVRRLRGGVLDPAPITGVPAVVSAGLSGLYDIVLHPQFATNQFVYLSYPKPVGPAPTSGPPPAAAPAVGGRAAAAGGRGGAPQQAVLAVARGRWDGNGLVDVKDVFVGQTGLGGPARMVFGRDGKLYLTTGGVGSGAQDPSSQAGKVLRLNDDGSVPADNPFVNHVGYAKEVYTLGHRSSLGLAVRPNGDIWQHENGPNGGDEINVLKPGGNYGWPIVSYGRSYPGPWQAPKLSHENFEQPLVIWVPSIAASGIAFYTGDRLPKWKGDVFVGALRVGEVPGTGHLQRILFNEQMEELRRESLLVPMRQRIRDVRQGPDQLLYVLTDDPKNGALLRIEPAP